MKAPSVEDGARRKQLLEGVEQRFEHTRPSAPRQIPRLPAPPLGWQILGDIVARVLLRLPPRSEP